MPGGGPRDAGEGGPAGPGAAGPVGRPPPGVGRARAPGRAPPRARRPLRRQPAREPRRGVPRAGRPAGRPAPRRPRGRRPGRRPPQRVRGGAGAGARGPRRGRAGAAGAAGGAGAAGAGGGGGGAGGGPGGGVPAAPGAGAARPGPDAGGAAGVRAVLRRQRVLRPAPGRLAHRRVPDGLPGRERGGAGAELLGEVRRGPRLGPGHGVARAVGQLPAPRQAPAGAGGAGRAGGPPPGQRGVRQLRPHLAARGGREAGGGGVAAVGLPQVHLRPPQGALSPPLPCPACRPGRWWRPQGRRP